MIQSSTNSKQHIAVTGASGQLGRIILRCLIADDTVERIVAIDIVEPPLTDSKLQWVKADVRDATLCQELEGVDVLMHLAFVVTKYLPREEFDDINIEGSKNVFRCAASVGIKQILYASSLAAYGVSEAHPDSITEDTPRILVSEFPYSAAKYAVEDFLDTFEADHKDIKVVRMRPSILVGVHLNNPLAKLFGKALSRGFIIGDQDVAMPIVWDEDVADAFILAMNTDASGAFNLSAEPLNTPAEIAQSLGIRVLRPGKILRSVLDKLGQLKILLGASDAIDPAWGKYVDIALAQCCAKARDELGWKPKCKTGIDVIRHYLQACGTQNQTDRAESKISSRLYRVWAKAKIRRTAP